MSLKSIKGIGPKTEEILKERGIVDVSSLLYTIPSSYTDYHLTAFSYTEFMNVKGTVVEDVHLLKLKNATKVSFQAMIEGMIYNVVLFNQNYLKNILKIGLEVVIIGKYDASYKALIAEKVVKREDYKEGIQPEYNIEGISNSHFQKIILEALKDYNPKQIIIPDSYFQKYGYLLGKPLMLAIHSPSTIDESTRAEEALKYYELLSFSIKIALIRKNLESEYKEPKKPDLFKIKDFIERAIPFVLTDDQKKAVNDIFIAMKQPHPMNMLLEGDVGSGKTIVALISSYAAYTASYQSLILVPTEALAFQHYKTFLSYLSPFFVKVALLTSSSSISERNTILEGLQDGSIGVVVGTHSLLSSQVVFKKLGFIVCDEQHKFGVNQRKIIREKGNHPDILYMTATPIPRTLSLTVYGDMKLETIHSLPANRGKIRTEVHTYRDYLKILSFVKSEIDDGRQAYFVSPIIEEDPDKTLTSVLRVKKDLDTYYKGYSIGLLHGRLSSLEKEDIIEKFMSGEIQILVSTSVIEVGIDNPKASVMVIIDANQFGLSSLHQLRGRIGRASDEGFCFLMVQKKELGDKLQILEESQDGFLISEEDLRERGPGDFLGTEQSGILRFRFADIFNDHKLMEKAMNDAKELISSNTKVVSFYESHLYNDNFD